MKYIIAGVLTLIIIVLIIVRNSKSKSEISLTPSCFSQNRVENLGLKQNLETKLETKIILITNIISYRLNQIRLAIVPSEGIKPF